MDTVIGAMKTFRNFDPQKTTKLPTSGEVTVSSVSVSVEKRSVSIQDEYRPGTAGHRPPPPEDGASGYGPGAAYGRKAAPHHHHSLKPDKSFDLDALFRSQREPQMSRTEAYSRIEISITKIQISISGNVPAEPAYKTRELGTAYSVTAVLEQEKGQEFYAKIKEVQENFRNVGRLWEANTADRTDPAALQQLDDARIAWVTELQESDPAGFRAWLQIHVGPHALNGNFDNCVKPKDFTLEDYNAWMCKGFADYESGTLPKAEDILGMEMPKQETVDVPEAPKQAEQTAAAGPTHKALVDYHNGHLGASSLTREEKEYLYDLFERCYDNNDSAYNNQRAVLDAITTRREGESDEDCAVRWKSSLAVFVSWANSQRGERQIMPDAIDLAQNRKPLEAKRKEGESDEDFMRRKIKWDADNAWAKQWLKVALVAENMTMGASLRYQNEQHAAWAKDLMNSDPAMFREYLELMVKPQVDHGNFAVAHVPPGFTINDYHQWMSKDTLEYL